jgi:hypothetical protein
LRRSSRLAVKLVTSYRLRTPRLHHLASAPAATRLQHFGAVATALQPRGIRVAPTPVPGATRLPHRHEGQPLGFKSDAALALRLGLNPRAIPEPLANNTRAEAENVPLGYCSVSPRPCAGAKPTQRPIAGTPCTERAESKTGRKIADKPHPSYPPSRANPCKPRSCEHPKTPLQGAPAQGSEVRSGWGSGRRAYDGRAGLSKAEHA